MFIFLWKKGKKVFALTIGHDQVMALIGEIKKHQEKFKKH